MTARYDGTLPRTMYLFFSEYDDGRTAPSFSKFARSIGVTLEQLRSFRKHKKFDLAWIECDEIKRDYLTDKALTKQFDPTFTKFLLSEADREATEEKEESISVLITVVD